MEHDRRALGAHGEALAGRWYTEHGYVVLAQNWRCRHGELDLVLGKPGLVVFCEVKARSSAAFGAGAEAVTPRKQARLRRLAAEWLGTNAHGPVDVRFDVVAVHRGIEVEVFEGVL